MNHDDMAQMSRDELIELILRTASGTGMGRRRGM